MKNTLLESFNPYTKEKLGEVEITSQDEINKTVEVSRAAQIVWGDKTLSERKVELEKLIKDLVNKRDEITELITAEMGKPIKESEGEFDKAIKYVEYYLEHVEDYIGDEITLENESESHRVVCEPLGVAAVILPWNFPFVLFVWGVIPNLLVGNTVVIKNSEEVPLFGKLIQNIIDESELQDGVIKQVYGNCEQGSQLVNKDIDLIWFTGSSKVGRELYELAGKKFIKCILELGGSSPTLVFSANDLDAIIPDLYKKRFSNAGQYCTALKRLIVQKDIYHEVVEKLAKHAEKIEIGDPTESNTGMSCLVSKKSETLLLSQLEDAIEKGAEVVGSVDLDTDSTSYCKPIILSNVTKDMRVLNEEVFGPVLPVIQFETEEEAIRMANDTEYGLNAQVYSSDLEQARRVARKLEAGMIDINGGKSSQPFNPFGGYKNSGKGREHTKIGFHELCNIKVISEKN